MKRINASRFAVLLALVASTFVYARGAQALPAFLVQTHPRLIEAFQVGAKQNVRCPRGSHVIGGGVPGVVTDLDLVTSAPYDGDDADHKPDDGWLAVVNNNSSNPYALNAYALCSRHIHATYVKTPKVELPNSERTEQTAFCPNDSLQVTGGGIEIYHTRQTIVVASSAAVDGPVDGDAIFDDGWVGAANNDAGHEAQMRVFAICAPSGFSYYGGGIPESDGTSTIVGDFCNAGEVVTGGGLYVPASGTNTGAVLHSSAPTDGLDAGSDRDDAWGSFFSNYTGSTQTVQTTTICVPL